jgi:polyphosphate kinase
METIYKIDKSHFLNREISWLRFAERLLDLAQDGSIPLMERIKFLSIFASGMDEFYQVRVAGLFDQLEADIRARSTDGLTPLEQINAIKVIVSQLNDRVDEIYLNSVIPSLSQGGIHIADYVDLNASDHEYLDNLFNTMISPVLTPLAVDPSHPFPYISNLSLNLAIVVGDPLSGAQRFARVKVPQVLDRFVLLPDKNRFVTLEQVIAAHLPELFSDMAVLSHFTFRVTRNADLTLAEEEADDLLEAVEMELRRRRFGRAVKLELQSGTSDYIKDLLVRELELDSDDVYFSKAPLDLTSLMDVYRIDRPDLHEKPFKSVPAVELIGKSSTASELFKTIKSKNILLHHPYESFTTSVEALISKAASDPKVLAIKQTLYRTSGDSPIVKSLIKAAENGKQVAVLIELKARFDEQANIEWAKVMERAGVHVVYGLVGLKTHSKCVLIVRQEGNSLVRYCHIGTGNYNSRTARMYEDIGLFTADEQIGADLSELFNYLTGYSKQSKYRKLVVAPSNLRRFIINKIQEQSQYGQDGYISMKVNGLTDRDIIEALYRASSTGVRIELLVRGVCSLLPGLSGVSDNIKVTSIVGRFLEHSRILKFGSKNPEYYFGSADLMERNLDRRVEVLLPIEDDEIKARLEAVLDIELKDDVNSWELQPDGTYKRINGLKRINCQEILAEMANDRVFLEGHMAKSDNF